MSVMPSPVVVESTTGRLRDGTLVRVRPSLPGDQANVRAFLEHVSPHSLDLRFMAPIRPALAATEILAPCGTSGRVSLLMELTDSSPAQVIAHGEYVQYRSDPSRAEVAFLVADDRHGQGAATLLLLHLARWARSHGILRFDGVTLPENRAMLDVFVGAGFPCSLTTRGGVAHIAVDISHEPPLGSPGLGPVGNRPKLRA